MRARLGTQAPARPCVAREPADQAAAVAVDPDRLAAAMRTLHRLQLMAQAHQRIADLRRDAVLDLHLALHREQPRQVDRLLNVEAIFQHVGEEQRVAHRLEMPAHHPERHHRLAVLHHHARNDRVHRPLARRDAVRMAALDPEAEAAVLQHHARLLRQDGRAEPLEQRVDEAARVAVLVDDAEVDRVAMRRQHRLAGGRQRRSSPCRRRSACAARQILRAQQLLHRHIDLRRVGNERVAVAIGEARSLDMAMIAQRAERTIGCGRQAAEHAEDHQRR